MLTFDDYRSEKMESSNNNQANWKMDQSVKFRQEAIALIEDTMRKYPTQFGCRRTPAEVEKTLCDKVTTREQYNTMIMRVISTVKGIANSNSNSTNQGGRSNTDVSQKV